MHTKLTLRLEDDLIEFGKRWAKQQGKTLSGLVSDYLATLEKLPQQTEELPPATKQLLGLARGASEEDYHRYLEEKYR
ncbi:MAG: toxin-antitoxin system protein [Candidatus Schekmanbacteria bacterium]|nr:toxin-antitoxin system protein [Candidatus Schekmanbacteria bacterium]